MDQASQVHQAATVVGHDVFGACLDSRTELVLAHCHRHFRELHGKCPAESAAQLVVVHLDEVDVLHIVK